MLCVIGATFGQTRRARKPTEIPDKPLAAANPNGGWSGVVTLRKTLRESENSGKVPAFGRLDKERNYTITNRTRDYRYEGKAIIDGSGPQTTAKARVEFSDEDKTVGKMVIVDSCHAFNDVHEFIDNSTAEKISKASGSGDINNFSLYVDQTGRYNLSLRFPDAKGTYNDSNTLTRSGYCQAKNNEPKSSSNRSDINVRGESVSVRGEIDPKNPDVIAGTETSGGNGSFAYSISWRFTRKPQNLLVTDVRFEHMKYPTWDNWVEVVDQIGTIDGNLVKVKANIANLSDEAKYAEITFKETYKGDKWNGAMPDYPLHESVSIKLDPNEVREVEVLWNTQGFAWFNDGRPRDLQRVKVEAWENYKKQDEMTRNLKLSPKPLVIVPGIWTEPTSLEIYQNLLTTSHSYGWKAITYNGNLDPNGQPRSVFDYADDLERKVQKAQTDLNAWHVDMLGHSSGGLIARVFVHKFGAPLPDNYPRVKHLMLLGTPNLGVACTGALESEFESSPQKLRTARELFFTEMPRFNQFVVNRNGTKFSALVGNSSSMLCAPLIKGDGVVEVESAIGNVEDVAYSSDKHKDLVEPRNFGEFVKPRVATGPRGTYPLMR
jgi:pimeloyl-ACP methyl ester carboxylesterase